MVAELSPVKQGIKYGNAHNRSLWIGLGWSKDDGTYYNLWDFRE